jgi:hypothetical protein
VELNQAALNRLQLNPSGRIEDYLASSTPMMPPEPALFEQPEIPVVEGGARP